MKITMGKYKGLPSLLGLIMLSVLLVITTPFVSWAATDEIMDGPIEGVGATDEVFSQPGLTGDWGGGRT